LEDAYIDARYGGRVFTEAEARECVELAKKFVEFLKNVENGVWRGSSSSGYIG
ncbi:MAG: HEPN domain-containing protein, partial [Candidatus Methanodesulfokora sp.]